MRLKLLFLFFLFSLFTYGNGDKGGYIRYSYNTGTGKYDFKIYTWTKAGGGACELTLYIDGGIDTLVCPRINGTIPCSSGSGVDGVIIDPVNGSYNGVGENIYAGSIILSTGVHVFTAIDVNRDAGINNLPNPSSISFAITDTLYLYTGLGINQNNSPLVSFAPIDNACVGMPFCYNPGIIDPDNDSLDFSISRSYMDDPNNTPAGVQQIGTETFPSGFSINRHTGTLCWSSSTVLGEYDISILIKEYRMSGCTRILVGKTLLDIPIHVVACPSLNVFYSSNISDTCIVAGNTYSVQTNVNSSGSVTAPINISAVGVPFTSINIGTNATFSATSSGNSATGIFNWSPVCDAVNIFPYNITVRSFDNSVPANARYETFSVKVIAPPPTNLTVNSIGNNVTLNWTAPVNCGPASGNILTNYDIYRNDSCVNYIPSACQTGAPSGYIKMGASSTTSYMDTNAPNGVHSYIAVARFLDCSSSIASSSACTVVTEMENISLNKNISIYPNPTSDQFFIDANTTDKLIVDLFDLNGRHVFSAIVNNKSNIDVKNLNEGVYSLTIKTTNRIINKKLVIVR
jgi:hypothetical protein